MRKVKYTKKQVAKEIFRVIDKNPKIYAYYNFEDIPYENAWTCATIGLSEYDIDCEVDEKPLRIEIIGVCSGSIKGFDKMISTISFEIMDAEDCMYGDIVSDIIPLYNRDCEMKHFHLTALQFWGDFSTLEFDDRKVT